LERLPGALYTGATPPKKAQAGAPTPAPIFSGNKDANVQAFYFRSAPLKFALFQRG